MNIGANGLCRASLSNHKMWNLRKKARSTAFSPLRGAYSDRVQRHGSLHALSYHAVQESNDPGSTRTLNSSRAHRIRAYDP
jgi:hypothetical protein